ncbi:MAG: hypothetical protein ACTSXQ_08125 [Alphaproteobacteria bacterium]
MLEESQNIIINMPRDWFDYFSVIGLPLVVIGISILQWRISEKQKGISLFKLKNSYIQRLTLMDRALIFYSVLLEKFLEKKLQEGDSLEAFLLSSTLEEFQLDKFSVASLKVKVVHMVIDLDILSRDIDLLFESDKSLQASEFIASSLEIINADIRLKDPQELNRDLSRIGENLHSAIELLQEEIRLNKPNWFRRNCKNGNL